MFDFERLQKDLNDFAIYLLNSIKRDYGLFFSPKKEAKLNEMIKDENLVVIDTLVGGNKIHINPNHEIFKVEDYNQVREYFKNNFLIGDLLRFFLTFSISEKEFASLEQANSEQSFSLFLKNGFVSYISKEFCLKNRLLVPEERYQDNMEFVEELEKKFPSFASLKSLAFSKEYLGFSENFYELTGENLLDFYCQFLEQKKAKEAAIEVLEFEEDIRKSGR